MADRISDDIIASLVLFSTAPGEARQTLAEKGVLFEAEPDQVLFDEKERSREIYFIVTGKVMVYVESEGGELPLAEFESGGCFGELSALDAEVRSGKAVVIEQATLIRLDSDTFNDLVEKYSEISHAIIRRLVETIRRMDIHVSELSALSETTRITRELIRLSRPDPETGGSHIPSLPNHAQLSMRTGTPPSRIAEIMGWLTKEGIIGRTPGNMKMIVIKDISKMKLMAEVGA